MSDETGDIDTDWFEGMMPFLEKAMRMKTKMTKRGLRRARTTCVCEAEDNTMILQLNPRNSREFHIHARCDKCKRHIME